MKYDDLKEQVYLANLEIPEHRLAIYTWGNVSQVNRKDGVFAIKPSGVAYEDLRIDDIVVLDLEGKVVEGSLRPSSDTPTHLELYRSFSEIGGICHTHSPYGVAWAQAGKSIPLLGTTHADHLANPIPCTPYLTEIQVKTAYEQETGKLIVETFGNSTIAMDVFGLGPYPDIELSVMENPMVLVAGHGPFTWGSDGHKSVYNASVLEETAKVAMWTTQINPHFSLLPEYIIKKHYERKHGYNAYYGQD